MNDDRDSLRPEEIKWHEDAPEGKLDLLINLDFRMAGTALYSDIVLTSFNLVRKTRFKQYRYASIVHPFNSSNRFTMGSTF